MRSGPRNPYLADSSNAIGHGRCDQQDSFAATGPTGPTETLSDADLQFQWLGPGHFGGCISSPYPDGTRVIWSNGLQTIVKLDHETLEILATHTVQGQEVTSMDTFHHAVRGLDTLEGQEAIDHALTLALNYMAGLDGVYKMLDCDNRLLVGYGDRVVAYADADPTDRNSAIVEAAVWAKPDHIEGSFVGINMTFDGRIVVSTDHGWVIALTRDFADYDAIRLPGADAAADHWRRMQEAGKRGYGWVRTSLCTGDDGGIYVSSVDTTHKVVWTGQRLSLDEADGAWSATYRNGAGWGSGTTPSLMGFGPDEDRFVVIGDGDDVVNITLFWRDEIPHDWEQLPDAPSRRIAGLGPANMGDPHIEAIQTEQSITVSGYGAMTVNNEPATIPETFPTQGHRLLVFFLGHHPEYTPYGLHKYEWDPHTRTFEEAWVCTTVSSPNSVPSVSEGADLVYTCGARDGAWTIEALDWTTGQEAFHFVVGDSRFNTGGAGIVLDEEGRIVFGSLFGVTRILR